MLRVSDQQLGSHEVRMSQRIDAVPLSSFRQLPSRRIALAQ
jgi:hypothetical protein